MGWHNDFDYGWHGTSGGIVMALVMLLIWMPLVGLGIWLIARMIRRGEVSAIATNLQPPVDSARGILDRRFAKGELTAEQYSEMRRVLEVGQ